ncbi:MAG: hypothetical protein EPO68_06750 [Planctomycetota bacterium]|nr:MAG: hypothetical protein EPO68_06750 [Planctomycetota bacterium]
MQTSNLVVVRYQDGRTVKGTTRDYAPGRPVFHVETSANERATEVQVKLLKAVFFVKSLAGDAARQDVRGFVQGPADTKLGRKIAVLFGDGELLCGYTQAYSPGREAFTVFPSDARCNNQRVVVMAGATREIQSGPAADELALRAAGPQAQAG